MLTGLFKDARFGPFLRSTHVYFSCESLSLWTMPGLKTLAHLYLFFTRVFSRFERCGTLAFLVWGSHTIPKRLFKNASFGPPPNPNKRISLVEVYRFGQCLSWRFSPISTFISLVSSRAFRDAPHLRFRCGHDNQFLPNFLKMQLLGLPQIYTRVFNSWKSIDLDSVWVGDSRPYQLSFL